MNPQEQAFLQQQDQQMRNMQSSVESQQVAQTNQALLVEQAEGNIIKEQLDLREDIKDLRHQLKGDIKSINDKGETVWKEPDNKDLIILSEDGVNYCMYMVQAYLTKNTLLSNYSEETINHKMEDFSITLADTLFMKYDKYFLFPTLEECKKELKKRIEKKIELKAFANELVGIEKDEGKIKAEVMKELENRIEKELDLISKQKMKDKLKMYDSVQRLIQDSVHSAYLRALNGQERRTLRQHIHISEQRGGVKMPQQSKGIFNWLKPS